MTDPWLKFYPTDWRSDPKLRMCGLSARGLWIELISIMHEASPYGHLLVSGLAPTDTQLAVLVGASSDQIPGLVGELESAGVFSRTREGVIYSRRMTRAAKKSAIARKNGKNGGNPTLRKQKGNSPSDNQKPTDSVKPQKPEAIYQTASQLGVGAGRHENLSSQLEAAAGFVNFREERHPGLMNLAPILGLIDAGYLLEDEILPAIRSKNVNGFRPRSWAFYDQIVREFAAKRRGVAQQKAPEAVCIDWAQRVTGFYEEDIWPMAWGPKPGDPGCEAPAELIKRTAA